MALSKSNLVSIGEVIQGLVTITLVIFLYGFPLGLRLLLNSFLMTFAFAGVVIFVGSLSFFSSRGSQLSYVLLNVILTFSLFPLERALQGKEQWILYLPPILMTATLPRLASLTGDFPLFFASFTATLGLFYIAMIFFQFGLKKYKTKNYLFLNE